MEGVEDIPANVLEAGLSWGWETYGEYLDVLDTMPRVIDIGGMITHAATRLFVMGPRGADHRERANAHEIARMGIVVRDAIRDGALGFSTSRSRNHKTRDGRATSSLDCAHDELLGIDGGAHCTMIADASNPTYMLTHWARDRSRGPQLPLRGSCAATRTTPPPCSASAIAASCCPARRPTST